VLDLVRDPAGRITTSTETTAGGDHTITMTYNEYGQVLTANDAATGLVTTNSYDNQGNLLTTVASRMSITNTVDVDGTLRNRVTVGPDPELTVTEQFDAFGRLTKSTTTAFGAGATTITYGGGKRTITPPVGAVISETFNGRGLVAARSQGDTKLTMSYDGSRLENVTSVVPNLNSSMTSVVDVVGRNISTIEDTGAATYTKTTTWANRTGTEAANWLSLFKRPSA
jgi:YD repeat-containing protein